MKILILGGTAWLGHSIAAAALAAGHSVVCLARGNAIPEGADLVNADRARGDALAGVAAGTWDAVVDVAGDPRFVERAVRDLAPAAKRFVFISSLNVYADPSKKGIVEDEPTLPPLPEGEEASQENYGRAKSACEEAGLAGFGRERSTIVRPGLITGPGDPTNRAAYWPLRFAKPSNPRGRVLVPDAFGQAFSVIDARDLAAWIVRLIEAEIGGVFNAVGNVSTLGDWVNTWSRFARRPATPARSSALRRIGCSPGASASGRAPGPSRCGCRIRAWKGCWRRRTGGRSRRASSCGPREKPTPTCLPGRWRIPSIARGTRG